MTYCTYTTLCNSVLVRKLSAAHLGFVLAWCPIYIAGDIVLRKMLKLANLKLSKERAGLQF